MFLIEYQKGHFVNANYIEMVRYMADGIVAFSTNSDDSVVVVDRAFAGKFINRLQALNGNISNIESGYAAISKGENK